MGIDEYARQPLSSCANDARKVLETLERLAVVDNAMLLINGDATKKAIKEACRDVCRDDTVDRLVFYFAGHGLLAYPRSTDATRTTLMTIRVDDVYEDGEELLDFSELFACLHHSGPAEQFFLIDACRDLNYPRYPTVGDLAWNPLPERDTPKQAVLYAVQERGSARGTRGEHGLLTRNLLDACESAVVWDRQTSGWAVTIESIRDYVRDAIRDELAASYAPGPVPELTLPQLDLKDRPSALLRLTTVNPRRLAVRVHPDSCAPQTYVYLTRDGENVPDAQWPPLANGQTMELPPRYYSFRASSELGAPEPAFGDVDVRRRSELRIEVLQGAGAPLPDEPPARPDGDLAAPLVHISDAPAGLPAGMALMRSRAVESETQISVEGLEAPHIAIQRVGVLDEHLPPGPYRIRFRLGLAPFSGGTVVLEAGRAFDVTPVLENSEVVDEVLGIDAGQSAVVLSESIGQMQAATLPTMLTMLGAKLFDQTGELFGGLSERLDTTDIPSLDARLFNDRPVVLVVAVEGRWPHPPEIVVNSLAGELVGGKPFEMHQPLPPLAVPSGRIVGDNRFRRVGVAAFEAPTPNFRLRLSSQLAGEMEIACATLKERITVVRVVLRPDGPPAIGQSLLRIPGRTYSWELAGDLPYARMVRDLQIGEELNAAGRLVPAAVGDEKAPWSEALSTLQLILYAKWTDPLLGCMGVFGWRAYVPNWQERYEVRTAAENLVRFFGDLPDVQIIDALVHPERSFPVFETLLRDDVLPLLAESVLILGRHAEQTGMSHSAIAQMMRRLDRQQPWAIASEAHIRETVTA
ncbi:MAG: caspase family protein [Solirubrobacteraceae bacterium]